MEPEISEFSYGYALTEQFIKQLGPLAAAPKFPSLGDEGELGYDLDLSFPARASLFLQFKRSHIMVKGTAAELNSAAPLPLALPFYRMHFWQRDKSDQHRLLVELALAGEEVYYVAPEFAKATELNATYAAGTVVQRSAWFKPDDIGLLPDNDKHHLAFEANTFNAWFCSEPKKIRRSRPPLDISPQRRRSKTKSPSVLDELNRLIRAMVSVLEREDVAPIRYGDLVLSSNRLSVDRPDVVAPHLARMYFNSVLILVADEPPEPLPSAGVS